MKRIEWKFRHLRLAIQEFEDTSQKDLWTSTRYCYGEQIIMNWWQGLEDSHINTWLMLEGEGKHLNPQVTLQRKKKFHPWACLWPQTFAFTFHHWTCALVRWTSSSSLLNPACNFMVVGFTWRYTLLSPLLGCFISFYLHSRICVFSSLHQYLPDVSTALSKK